MQSNLKIAFIGGGNMAQALIGGLSGKLTEGSNIHVVDVVPETLTQLTARFGVTTAMGPSDVVAMSDVIVLAVKPQQLRDVASSLRPYLKSQLVLSIAAGIRAADLSRWFGGYQAIVRTMPNTPALVGKGVTGAVAMAGVSDTQRQIADAMLRAVGETVWIADEAQMDAVTAISGSGPAYVFYFIEAMQQAAVELGLTAEQGRQLAQATFAGASELAIRSDEPVSLLRERVTSKGGTTERGLAALDAAAVKLAIGQAVEAASRRSAELGDELGRLA